MNTRPLWLTSSALMSLLLLSGCIKMTVTQTIEATGSSHIEVVYDATELMQSMEEFSSSMDEGADTEVAGIPSETSEITEPSTATEPEPESTETAAETQKICDDFHAQTTWKNANCTVEGYIFTMSGDVTLTSPAFETSTGAGKTTYRYDLKNIYDVLSAVSSSQGQDFSDATLKEQKGYVEMTGIELAYTLTMPGVITSTDVGEIQEDGSTVSINLFDLPDHETAFVESEEASIPWLWIGIGGAVLAAGGGVVVMVRRKKSPGAETVHMPSVQ